MDNNLLAFIHYITKRCHTSNPSAVSLNRSKVATVRVQARGLMQTSKLCILLFIQLLSLSISSLTFRHHASYI